MKRYIIILITTIFGWQATNAMSYEQARQEALYLTDKMAYELNLNDQQYNDAYEINLDYFLSLNNEADLYKDYLSYRLSDLRHILYDWQYNLMIAADYFIRPIYWRSGVWHFSIYNYYDHGYFYYSYPTVYYSYRGGHGRIHHHHGFYANRRPTWNGGMRSQHAIGGRYDRNAHNSVTRGRIDRVHGDGYHPDFSKRGEYSRYRGNSFEKSSSRNPRTERGHQEGTRDNSSNRRYGGLRGSDTNGNYNSPRNSGINGSYGETRSSGMNRERYSLRPNNGHSGPRGSNSGGNISRGRRKR